MTASCHRRFAALVLGLGLLAGCSRTGGTGGEGSPQAATLQEVSELLRAASAERPPAKAADLARYEHTFPKAYQAVKSGEVVVVWGGRMKPEGESGQGGGEVIAYEKNVPTGGGLVLLTSGQVKQMSADEFKAAPKAKG